MSRQHVRPQGAFGVRVESTRSGDLPPFQLISADRAGAGTEPPRPRHDDASPATNGDDLAEAEYASAEEWPAWTDGYPRYTRACYRRPLSLLATGGQP
jgi:hypothetical protein